MKSFTLSIHLSILFFSSVGYNQGIEQKISQDKKKLPTIYSEFNFQKQTFRKLAPTINPTNQDICTGQAIQNITTSPVLNSPSLLDCETGGGATFLSNTSNTGIFFDITNSGSIPLRINGIEFNSASDVVLASNSTVPFTLYRTTNANSASGNYTDSTAWTSLGTYNFIFPPSQVGAIYTLPIIFNDNGFTLLPGQSTGFYISCGNTSASGFKIVYRSQATSTSPISNSDITVIHRVRATGLFQTDNGPRGFYGNILYNIDTFGYWTRNNTTNVTGSSNAGDLNSGNIPFPISGSLTNNTNSTQIVTYTIVSFDVNGIKDVQDAFVNVEPQLDNSVSVNGSTLTANQSGATYQWFACEPTETLISGATSQSYSPASSDVGYKVRINLGPCEIDSNCTNTLSNNEFNLNDKFKIYPNPSKTYLNISSELKLSATIFNQLGQLIKKIEVNSFEPLNITTTSLSKGVYFIRAETEDQQYLIKKFIIE